MASRVPNEIVLATANGDAATVQSWLESGGDANQELPFNYRQLIYSDDEENIGGQRLLAIAAEHEHCDLIRLLLAHGAEVGYKFYYYGPGLTALYVAVDQDSPEAAQILLENGADINFEQDPLGIMRRAARNPRLLRIMLIAGVDADAKSCKGEAPEDYARSRLAYFRTSCNYQVAFYAESVAILEGARLAGSYKGYVLAPYKELLRLRSLLARDRASIGPTTPEVVARLFGGRAGFLTRARPLTRRIQAPPRRTAGVPGPVFWKVMEYWRLGGGGGLADWRRRTDDWRRGDWRHPERHP